MSKEFKLGIFILGAIIILIVGIFSIRDFRIFNPGYTIKVVFNFGDGLKPASPVRVAGIEAGEVKKISLVREGEKTKVIVYAWIRKDIKIPSGSQAFVNSLGVLGEKYLEIIPQEGSGQYLKEGDSIVGEDSVPLYTLGKFVRAGIERFYKLLNTLDKLVREEEIISTFKKFVGSLEGVSSDLGGFFRDLRERRGTVGRLIYEDTLYKDIEEFIKDLKAHPWKLLHKSR
ncbi:MAG TPA: MCE family protein [Candidatus Omnitrophica bacterium]|nr:MCE family protein [Candidatus Omnitrophota bacterium]